MTNIKRKNIKKLGQYQSIGLMDAWDKLNTPHRKEDAEQ
jgi:hypothetical protein